MRINPTTDAAEMIVRTPIFGGHSPSIRLLGIPADGENIEILQPGIDSTSWDPIFYKGEQVVLNNQTNRLNMDTGTFKVVKPATTSPIGVEVICK